MPKRLTAHDVENVLTTHGFECISQRGSHRKWHNQQTGAIAIVPYHGSKPLPIGTLYSIIRASKLQKSDFGF